MIDTASPKGIPTVAAASGCRNAGSHDSWYHLIGTKAKSRKRLTPGSGSIKSYAHLSVAKKTVRTDPSSADLRYQRSKEPATRLQNGRGASTRDALAHSKRVVLLPTGRTEEIARNRSGYRPDLTTSSSRRPEGQSGQPFRRLRTPAAGRVPAHTGFRSTKQAQRDVNTRHGPPAPCPPGSSRAMCHAWYDRPSYFSARRRQLKRSTASRNSAAYMISEHACQIRSRFSICRRRGIPSQRPQTLTPCARGARQPAGQDLNRTRQQRRPITTRKQRSTARPTRTPPSCQAESRDQPRRHAHRHGRKHHRRPPPQRHQCP